jgi:N12 class adenine-specific DNA methylase
LQNLGFDTQNRRVLEPGCGSGVFMGVSPEDIQMIGVELDPTSAKIASYLYPDYDVRNEDYAKTNIPDGYFDGAIGNVPFAQTRLYDPVHNKANLSLHNHFISKSLDLVKPGGVAAFITSTFTMDAKNSKARDIIGEKADLIGAVRLPAGAHMRAAGTEAMSDVLFFRKREEGQTGEFTASWKELKEFTAEDDKQVMINQYFANHPENIIGSTAVGTNQFGQEILQVTSSETPEQIGADMRQRLNVIEQDAIGKGLTFNKTEVDQSIKLVAPHEAALDGHIRVVDPTARTLEFVQVQNGVEVPFHVSKTQSQKMAGLLELRDDTVALLNAESTSSEDSENNRQLREQLNRHYDMFVNEFGPLNSASKRERKIKDELTDKDAQDYIDNLYEERNQTMISGTDDYQNTTDEIEKLENKLNKEGSIEVDLGNKEIVRVPDPVMRFFKQDPQSSITLAIENYDFENDAATKAAIMEHRIVAPRQIATHADTPLEAIQLSLNSVGKVDLETISELLDVEPNQAMEQIHDYVFEDPEDITHLITKNEYLSGNIYQKIDVAQAAKEKNPDIYSRHVEALERVLPKPLTADEIVPKLGAAWIDAPYIQQFTRELLRDSNAKVITNGKGEWNVKGYNRSSLTATDEWGTKKRNGYDLIKNILNRDEIKVTYTEIDENGVKQTHTDREETELALNKAEEIKERFTEWAFEDPTRCRNLTDNYNRLFNGTVLRDFTEEANALTFPGLADGFVPREHQRIAAARMINDPAVLLAHEVGAGKTSEMIMGAMELKRLGLINKPVVVIPNPLLDQFSAEWLERYPQAKILAASSTDVAQKDKRHQFVAKAALNDWDAVIMTREAFQKIEVTPEALETYVNEQVADLRRDLEYARDNQDATGGRFTVKSIEKAIESKRSNLQKKLDSPRDEGMYFEDTGFDYIIVDEAHGYKNIALPNSNLNAGIAGSKRSQDLDMKLRILREREGNRIATFATGTPISNAVAEAYVMNHYLRPDVLESANCYNFGQWASTFGQEVTELELGPSGNIRLHKRFSKFDNVPELLKLWATFTDTKTGDQLHLERPEIKLNSKGEHAPELVSISSGSDLKEYMQFIIARTNNTGRQSNPIKSENGRWESPENDNMLSISGDGRKAALDMRLVDPTFTPDNPKVNAVADKVYQVWVENRDNEYTDISTGQPSTKRGGLQLVFCDLSTPNANKWNFYDELKEQLVNRGMPANEIRFAHEAKNDQEKARMWEQGRNGNISVLLGSTEKMGTGVNVQTRVVAMHHVDCPWRPSDLTQREGRGIRQGNQNKEVGIYTYVTEGSFDAYMWQTVERKAGFINKIMNGKLNTRDMEDIDASTISAAQAKAIAAGDPRLFELAGAQKDQQKYERLERQHRRSQAMYKETLSAGERTIDFSNARITKLEELVPQIRPTDGEAFVAEINGQNIYKRIDAQQALARYIDKIRANDQTPWRNDMKFPDCIKLGGLTISAHFEFVHGSVYDSQDQKRIVFNIEGLQGHDLAEESYWKFSRDEGYSMIQRLENAVQKLPGQIQYDKDLIQATQREMETANEHLGEPFKYAEQLKTATDTANRVTAELRKEASKDEKPEEEMTEEEYNHIQAEQAQPTVPEDNSFEDRIVNAMVAATENDIPSEDNPFGNSSYGDSSMDWYSKTNDDNQLEDMDLDEDNPFGNSNSYDTPIEDAPVTTNQIDEERRFTR